jgi:hypothetical protein
VTDGPPPPWPPYLPLPRPPRTGGLRRLGSPLDWLLIGAALTAFGCSFGTFYTTRATLTGAPREGLSVRPAVVVVRGQQADAWLGFFGWIAVVLVLLCAVLTVLAMAGVGLAARLCALGSAAAGAAFVLLAAAITPALSLERRSRDAVRQARSFGLDFRLTLEHGRGVGFWVVLPATVLVLLLALIRVRADGRRPSLSGPTGGQPP